MHRAYQSIERGGNTKALVIESNSLSIIQSAIHQYCEVGSTLHTDEHGAYSGIGGLFFRHHTVNHSEGQWRRGNVSTNSIESVWAVLKRGLHGVYHHASKKHLHRYVDEFTFRLNFGSVKIHTLLRLDSFIAAVSNKRLTYKELTA